MELPTVPVIPRQQNWGLKIEGSLFELSSTRYNFELQWKTQSSTIFKIEDVETERLDNMIDCLLNPRRKTRYAYFHVADQDSGIPLVEILVVYLELDRDSYKDVVNYLFGTSITSVLGGISKKYFVLADRDMTRHKVIMDTVRAYDFKCHTTLHEALVDAFIPVPTK